MVCGPKKVKLHFEESGAVIRPLGLDLYINRTKFDYARVNITEEAGNHLLELSKQREPVRIESEGAVLGRFYLPDLEENVTVTEDDSFVKLHDQLKILQHRKVNKSYRGTWVLEDIINDIYSKAVKEDKYDVFKDHSPTGWVEFNEELGVPEGAVIDSFAGNRENVVNTFDPQLPVLENVVDSIGSSWRNNDWSIFAEDSDYDFEDVSAWEALYKIIQDFGIDIWVTKTGVLHIGDINGNGSKETTKTNVYTGGPGNNTAALSGLSATSPVQTIKEVRIRGGVTDDDQERNQERFHLEGQALRTDLDSGRTVTKNVPMTVHPPTLTGIARSTMINTYLEQNDGSATVDVLSSLDKGIDVRNSKPGDFFAIVGDDNCRREINSGGFFINQVHHKLNKRNGWTANFELIPIYPPGATIETETYWFNPTTDEYIARDEFEKSDGKTVGL